MVSRNYVAFLVKFKGTVQRNLREDYLQVSVRGYIEQIKKYATSDQGWEFALLLFRSSLFCSKALSLKSDCERFALGSLLKRATVSESLSSLLEKSELLFCSFALSHEKPKSKFPTSRRYRHNA